MSDSFKVSKDNIRKVEDYLRAGTLEKGVVSASMATIAKDVGMSGDILGDSVNVRRCTNEPLKGLCQEG